MVFVLLFALGSSRIKYGVVVDAGSSGTRAHIYTWDSTLSIPDVHPAPNVSNAWFIKKKIPLSDATKDINVIDNLFREIIEFCKTRIPQNFISNTRFFVYATGGLRLLSQKEQDKIMSHTYKFLLYNSPFKIKPRYIRVISGIEEGLFGWLSVNHLQNNFVEKKPTVGALDMGGASYQIALEVEPKEISGSLHNVSVGKKSLVLYAHSYLGYGVNQAIYKVSRSISVIKNQTDIDNPCYANNYNTTIGNINVHGTGNFEECSRLIEVMFLESAEFSSIQVPSLKQTKKFVAMASFHYVNQFFQLSKTSSIQELKEAAEKYCAQDWSITKDLFKDNEFAPSYCWYSIYQWNMLSKGYGFQDNMVSIEKTDEIHGVDLSWTIGAMLNEVAEIEFDDKSGNSMSVYMGVSTIIVFVCVFLLFIIKTGGKGIKGKGKTIYFPNRVL